VLQFLGGAGIRGLLIKSLRDDAVGDVVNNVNIGVKMTPKNPPGLMQALAEKINARKRKALSITAIEGINIIEDRTSKGQGVNGPFKSYTPQYAAFRAQNKLNTKPDLSFTGQMLSSMTASRPTSNSVTLFFRGADNARKAAFNNQTREFFSFNKRERGILKNIFKKRVL
jgi:hypothetical protein